MWEKAIFSAYIPNYQLYKEIMFNKLSNSRDIKQHKFLIKTFKKVIMVNFSKLSFSKSRFLAMFDCGGGPVVKLPKENEWRLRQRKRGKTREKRVGEKAEGYDSLVFRSCCWLTKINLSDLLFFRFFSRSDMNEINQKELAFKKIVIITSRRVLLLTRPFNAITD